VPLRGLDGTVDLLVVLIVGVALGEPRYFVDSLVGLLRVLLGVGLRLFSRSSNSLTPSSCLTGPTLPPGRVLLRAYPTPGTDAPARWYSASASGGPIATSASRSGDS
jgi:hypothetical protein